jgi:hypothetical protein
MREIIEGNPILPPATDGFIKSGHYASASDQSVFALRNFRSTVRRVGAEARWTRVGDGAVESLVMAITANDLIMSVFVQLSVNPAGWAVSTRRIGDFRRVMSGKFDPPLVLDREYRFEMDAADGSVTVRVPGDEKTGRVGTIGLLSERAYWRHAFAPTDRPIGVQFSANMVWAAEQGQPLSPIPGDG